MGATNLHVVDGVSTAVVHGYPLGDAAPTAYVPLSASVDEGCGAVVVAVITNAVHGAAAAESALLADGRGQVGLLAIDRGPHVVLLVLGAG